MAEGFSKETAQQRTYRAFEELIQGDEQEIDLAQAALLIASSEYPGLDNDYYMQQVERLARRVRTVLELPAPTIQPQLPPEVEPLEVLEALNHVLFEEEHFRGNQEEYQNPENSFFNRVLESRKGIPVTLALLYIEVGRRVGIPLQGVGLPWHFVVRYCHPEEIVYIDVFNQGRFLNERGCREMIRRLARGRIRMHPEWFEPVAPRHFLFRILNNLKHIYVQSEEYERALSISEFMVTLMPSHAGARRDRGIIHLHLKHYARSLHDLMAYIELAPEATDSDEILDQIRAVRQTLSMLN